MGISVAARWPEWQTYRIWREGMRMATSSSPSSSSSPDTIRYTGMGAHGHVCVIMLYATSNPPFRLPVGTSAFSPMADQYRDMAHTQARRNLSLKKKNCKETNKAKEDGQGGLTE